MDIHQKNANTVSNSESEDEALSDSIYVHFTRTEFEGEHECRYCSEKVVSSNYALLEDHIAENHFDKMTHNGTMTSPRRRCIRKQARLSYNLVREFYQRVAENSKCKMCEFILMGHNPNTLKKHLESHPEQYHQFSEMFQLAWKQKRKQMKEKGVKLRRPEIKTDIIRTVDDAFLLAIQ